MSNQRYMQRGVSASKEDVHNAIKNIDKGIFPKAFCKIIPDILGGDPEYCNIMHADGAGTKSSLAYLYWKETGDLSVWKGIAQDALINKIEVLVKAPGGMMVYGCLIALVFAITHGKAPVKSSFSCEGCPNAGSCYTAANGGTCGSTGENNVSNEAKIETEKGGAQ